MQLQELLEVQEEVLEVQVVQQQLVQEILHQQVHHRVILVEQDLVLLVKLQEVEVEQML